mmetsp:Transcript_32826/g.47522  ORF Transcript_32826/g.47522 Transcript_32826/m.47522 type:complete len:245 (-) Transcript_32826:542-1276(-)
MESNSLDCLSVILSPVSRKTQTFAFIVKLTFADRESSSKSYRHNLKSSLKTVINMYTHETDEEIRMDDVKCDLHLKPQNAVSKRSSFFFSWIRRLKKPTIIKNANIEESVVTKDKENSKPYVHGNGAEKDKVPFEKENNLKCISGHTRGSVLRQHEQALAQNNDEMNIIKSESLKLSITDFNAAAVNKARARIKVAAAVMNEIDIQIAKPSRNSIFIGDDLHHSKLSIHVPKNMHHLQNAVNVS